jgi:hypothetical protein
MTNEMKKLFNDHSCWLKRITVRLWTTRVDTHH